MSGSKTFFEDFSNEIFFEIFDYLYCQHILLTFSNLNSRFNLLCTYHSNYHIDTSDYHLSKKDFNYLLESIYSKHIRSLKFHKERFIRCISIHYLSSLTSITFLWITNFKLIDHFIQNLPLSHQLRHLSFEIWFSDEYLHKLSFTISKLPNLNRLEYCFNPNTFSVNYIQESLISIRSFSLNCLNFYHFIQLLPYLSNLTSLNLSYRYFDMQNTDITNHLLKLKYLEINQVKTYDEISYLFHLCPQIKGFKVNCLSEYLLPTMIDAKQWEEYLCCMDYLRRIHINIFNIYHGELIDLNQYKTDFWLKRNIQVIKYINTNSTHSIYDDEHKYSLLIISE